MAYMSCSGYSSESGYCCQSSAVSSSYESATSQQSVRVIGCTCGKAGPCRGTCRMPAP